MCMWPPAALLPDPVVEVFLEARSRLTSIYDETLHEVADRIYKDGSAGKLDVAGLAAWKRSAQGNWIGTFMSTPEVKVREITAEAFASGLTVFDRAKRLSCLYGFRRGSFAIGSALLCAFNEEEFPVTDHHARRALRDLFCDCHCALNRYSKFTAAVRSLQGPLAIQAPQAAPWTAHSVDGCLMWMNRAVPKATPVGALTGLPC